MNLGMPWASFGGNSIAVGMIVNLLDRLVEVARKFKLSTRDPWAGRCQRRERGEHSGLRMDTHDRAVKCGFDVV